MKTDLDLAMDQAFSALTAEGGMFATVPFRLHGRDLPMIAKAPPHLPAYFAYFCATHGDKTFIVDGDLRLSFVEVYTAARHVAGGLVEGLGVQKGEPVGLAARNSANWIIAYMAVLMAGGCVTLLNGWWQGEELADGIALVKCRYVIADEPRAARLADQDHGATVLPMAHDCPYDQGLAALLAKGGGPETMLPGLTGDDRATVLFTSGSTGVAKGAYSDHRAVVQGTMNYVAQTVAVLSVLTARGEGPPADLQPATLVNVPLFHVTGEVPVFLQSFAIGRKLVLMPKWDAEEAMRLIEREKVTYFVGVPLMSLEIATHPDRDKYDLSTCVSFAAGGAPRPVEHVARLRKALPHAFPLLGYGLTETNGVGCGNLNQNYLAKPGSTGTASRPLVDLAILDDAGNPLPQGEIGEVCIRSIANFAGYWDNPQSTREAVTDDGYFRSGDLGYLDPEDYLFIVDRKKDIIIRGGENISCIEVESAIYAHPCIAEASVFGLPDEKMGEVPAAVYLAREGCSATEAELRAFLMEHIAPYKMPVRFWEVTEPLPRLGTEKVDKRALRDRYTREWKASGAG
ncbi:AMP-dependent synthetase [Novosphingobium lubricantis]